MNVYTLLCSTGYIERIDVLPTFSVLVDMDDKRWTTLEVELKVVRVTIPVNEKPPSQGDAKD
ncbi:predicted protein [Pyrenophora tritici-repentis Pt-1C-BFP]|uniref:Uncharacterized protein n=1 Tax=Pyrenophora tritici-repentis (strain Pt-1C-BFP) TaxID=426418 RepID=B2WLE9_PYRTR|nr:uncharacterized protein PTRG_10809 [Pyrenophora tritici-repentis Pt-1C-BFP]EDU43859.1 predicted protein [Pyrenophora tritici-repentis Pt-1C-BFP]